MGASPDFLVFDSTEATSFGIGEVKCPFSKKNLSIGDACNDKNFFLQKLDGKVTLKQHNNNFIKFKGVWRHLILVGVILLFSQMLTCMLRGSTLIMTSGKKLFQSSVIFTLSICYQNCNIEYK